MQYTHTVGRACGIQTTYKQHVASPLYQKQKRHAKNYALCKVDRAWDIYTRNVNIELGMPSTTHFAACKGMTVSASMQAPAGRWRVGLLRYMDCLAMYLAASSLKTPFVMFMLDDEFTQNVYLGIVSQLKGTECGEADRDRRPESRGNTVIMATAFGNIRLSPK